MEMKEVYAIECTQNDRKFYSTVLNSKDLKEVCFISRRDENPEKGFQRLLNKTRASKISEYLDKNKGVIPSAVILSAQDTVDIKYNKKAKKLSFEIQAESFLIIDGQHRLYGLYEAKEFYEIPVIIFTGLSTTDEVNLFIDINTTQKGVPSALLLDIKELAAKETKVEEKQRALFNALAQESPLAGYLSSSKSITGKISRSAFNEATECIFTNGPLCKENMKILILGVKNYLTAVENVFSEIESEGARINKTVIFKAIFQIFNEVCTKSLQENGNLKVESLYESLVPISLLDYSQYTGTNKATVNKIVADMRSELSKKISVSEDMF